MASASPDAHLDRKNAKVGLYAFLGALFMLGMGYAAVPLYDLFCRVTGFGGTTQVASESEAASAESRAQLAGTPTISIRFDASTARDMPWTFKPVKSTDTIRIGQRSLAFYTAKNDSSVPITGTATFNVEPEQAGYYFNKIQCFCFTEQTLQPGQELRMPVLYYVDPAALDDPNMEGVEQITLSYTFHKKLEDGE
ncbi:cytochrome c oxidase assembly protein [Parerythrobacter aestuarii]|uniref:cytochrome c oxidase assembly protein n=1 Tax=Parerythrobacter aestuarii TaxID=3020909 RepID=UPI0024DE4BAD|nr:cytochrome c oxidase assembly protein [Parerythrobacter aestuarii]